MSFSNKHDKKEKREKLKKKKSSFFGEKCVKCNEIIKIDTDSHVKAVEKYWHEDHFTCLFCCQKIVDGRFVDWSTVVNVNTEVLKIRLQHADEDPDEEGIDNILQSYDGDNPLPMIVCARCAEREHTALRNASTPSEVVICNGCDLPIKHEEEATLSFHSKSWHQKCFVCSVCCKMMVSTSSLHRSVKTSEVKNDKTKPKKTNGGKLERSRTNESNIVRIEGCSILPNGDLCCQLCYLSEFTCEHCTRMIEGQYVEPEVGTRFHYDCFECSSCSSLLTENYYKIDPEPQKSGKKTVSDDEAEVKEQFVCEKCYQKIKIALRVQGKKEKIKR